MRSNEILDSNNEHDTNDISLSPVSIISAFLGFGAIGRGLEAWGGYLASSGKGFVRVFTGAGAFYTSCRLSTH